MIRKLRKKLIAFLSGRSGRGVEIHPDEIFLDSSNLPQFNTDQFEGRIEKPIGKRTILALGISFLIIGVVFTERIWVLQIKEGEALAQQSENNRLEHSLIFAERGVIYDRNGNELVWNEPNEEESFPRRRYTSLSGLAHVLGYVRYPLKDTSGYYYQDRFVGTAGIERVLDQFLGGINGIKIIETDARGRIQSESVIKRPRDGANTTLSVDADLSHKFYSLIKERSQSVGFVGGAGVLMDVNSGEIIALVSYPEYDPAILSDGEPRDAIKAFVDDERKPFLNRVISGLYTPGSIIKPFIAIGALNEGIIDPDKEILSTGSISVPNPYLPGSVSVFVDWKAHGWVDMRHALAVSSNVYFYEIAGGYEEQEGLGINRIGKYIEMFGLARKSGIALPSEQDGVIPNPAWKEENFAGDPWRLGDTYNTAIGQYGLQITPIQAVRGIAAIASNGTLVTPTLLISAGKTTKKVPVDQSNFKVVREGLRLAVTEGTATGLSVPYIAVAAKTGTAEIGISKAYVNSWVIGFFPSESPKYAFAVVMEHGPQSNLIGATSVMRSLLDWMNVNTPQYLEI